MKIYFAGSIRGGRDNIDIYSEIIKHLKILHEVLTEHVGDEFIRHSSEDCLTDYQIYERDCKLMEKCDCLIAEVTTPSLGVGYEIAYAEKLGKKIICLFNDNGQKQLSAMIAGNNNLKVLRYKDLSVLNELDSIIKEK